MSTILSHIVVPILTGLIMAFAYLGGFHKPEPHQVPVAVIGQGQEATALSAKLAETLGDRVVVSSVGTAAQAEDKLKNREIAAAYAPGKTQADLYVASGASESTASVVTKIFSSVAFKERLPLQTHDVAPLDSSDPIGQNGFFFMVALTVGSYATSIAIGAAAATRRLGLRIALAVGSAVVLATLLTIVSSTVFGMFAGHRLAVWGTALLYSAAILFFGVGMHTVLGRFSGIVYSALFVGFNFTTSGGVFSPVLQPALYGILNRFWIGAGFIDTVRSVSYFPGQSLAHPLEILGGWLALGLVALGVAAAVERRRGPAKAGPVRPGHDLDEATEEELEENVAVS